MAKSIEINIKLTIPAEFVEKEGITLQEAKEGFLDILKKDFPSEIIFEGEAHEV